MTTFVEPQQFKLFVNYNSWARLEGTQVCQTIRFFFLIGKPITIKLLKNDSRKIWTIKASTEDKAKNKMDHPSI